MQSGPSSPPVENTYAMSSIAEYQFFGVTQFIEITVTIDRTLHKLRGRRTCIQQIGPRTVVLLSPESTTDDHRISPTAQQEFLEAASDLVKNDKGFYTELRPGWSVPALHWTKAP